MRPAILVLLLPALLLPASADACGACIESIARYQFAYYYWILFTLLGWYGIHRVITVRANLTGKRHGKALFKALLLSFGIGLGLIVITTGSTILLAVVLFVVLAHELIRHLLKRTPPISNTFAPAATTFGIVSILVVLGTIERARTDPFDYARSRMISSASNQYFMARDFASDPTFDLERLRPLLTSDASRDREWAFRILQERGDPADLELFRDEVMALPDGLFEEGYHGTYEGLRLRMWLDAINVADPRNEEAPPPGEGEATTEESAYGVFSVFVAVLAPRERSSPLANTA